MKKDISNRDLLIYLLTYQISARTNNVDTAFDKATQFVNGLEKKDSVKEKQVKTVKSAIADIKK